MNELDSLLRAAGRMMLDYQSPKVFSKGHHADFVTEADIAVQSYLVDALQRAYPHAKFLAEEEERHVLTDALTFIIDPIDGTTNYFRRRRCSMISIGAVENKLPVFGGLYDPYTDEMYLAERGKGATCNGERIRVSDTPIDTRADWLRFCAVLRGVVFVDRADSFDAAAENRRCAPDGQRLPGTVRRGARHQRWALRVAAPAVGLLRGDAAD